MFLLRLVPQSVHVSVRYLRGRARMPTLGGASREEEIPVGDEDWDFEESEADDRINMSRERQLQIIQEERG